MSTETMGGGDQASTSPELEFKRKWRQAEWEKRFVLVSGLSSSSSKKVAFLEFVQERVYRPDRNAPCKDYYGFPKKEILERITDGDLLVRTLNDTQDNAPNPFAFDVHS